MEQKSCDAVKCAKHDISLCAFSSVFFKIFSTELAQATCYCMSSESTEDVSATACSSVSCGVALSSGKAVGGTVMYDSIDSFNFLVLGMVLSMIVSSEALCLHSHS